jgi:hypothetical protein
MNIMNAIKHINKILFILLSLIFIVGCDDDNTSDLQLSGDTWLKTLKLDEYQGIIDNSTKSVVVGVPVDYNTDAMKVTAIEVSDGAEASMKVGDVVNFSFPQTIKVTNGDAFLDYTVTVKHDEARITSFKLNNEYTGIIDEENHSIVVRIPTSTDITSLIPTIETTEGATVSPASGQAVDFTNPVEFTVTYQSATTVYVVSVVQSDSPSAVYVGLASSIDELNPEEKEAANWMLKNIPNAQYLSFDDIRADRVKLDECKVMWWHLHIDGGIDSMTKFEAAAPSAVQAVSKIKEFYENGGSLLLTRFATFYAAQLGITKDGNAPNNCWGQSEETAEITTGPWSFFVTNHADHPLYEGVVSTIDGKDGVYMCDTGYRITNSTAQWHIGSDWGGYDTLNAWETNHGATSLGYGGDGSVVAWEYPSNGTTGGVLCIGSGCYDWYAYGVDTSADQYHGNVAKVTQNAINYLISESK